MYKEKMRAYAVHHPYGEIADPASSSKLEAAQQHMHCSFPKELRDMLLEADGDGYLLFSVAKILETHKLLIDAWREVYPDIGRYLFFAENGCGDYYGYYLGDQRDDPAIFIWEHETGERHRVANSMEEFIDRYEQGEI